MASTNTAAPAPPRKKNYVNNRDLLAELQRSKNTYCEFLGPEFARYDAIVASEGEITAEAVARAREARSGDAGADAPVVFRVMCGAHVPEETDEAVLRRRRRGCTKKRTPFPPFRHFWAREEENGGLSLVEVGRSHWRGGFANGGFCPDGGRPTEELARMWMAIVRGYGSRGSWRGYSWREDFESAALLQLTQTGLQFCEGRGSNVFAYYSTVVANAFKRALGGEHRQRDIRDEMLMGLGEAPSWSRQADEALASGTGAGG